MPSVFEALAADARGVFYDLGGVPVTYKRGAESVTLTAIPVTQGKRWSDAVSAGVWAGIRMWTVKAADLASLTDPAPLLNDELEDADGLTWKVLSPDGGPVFKEIDGEGLEYEIATKAYEVSA